MGTNGAGTALATGRPVVVQGDEHYLEAFRSFTCVAAPIRDGGGNLVGAIDLSTSLADGKPANIGLMSYVALMIERDLVHARREYQWRNARQAADELAARETQWRRAHERLQLILDHVPVLVYLVDESGRIVEVNKAWQSLSGLDASSVVGRTLDEVFDRPVASRFAAHNRLVLDTGQPRSFEEEYAGRSYLSVKVPVRDPDGRSGAVCGLSIDITERKRAEDLLRAEEERFRVMADWLPLIIWVHDADGALQFVNRTYCEFFGVTLDQACAGGWQSLVHPDDAAYAVQFADAVRRQGPFHAQVRVRRADGQWRWIESWGRPRFSEDGRFLGFVGSSADVTERRSTEERLREAQGALEEAIRRKNEFIATLAHEIRNPLAAIRNASAALGAPAADLDKARGIIDRQIDSLVRLVEDLLEMSRLRLGKTRLVCRRLDVRSVVDDAVVACQALFASSHQRLRVERPEDPVWVRADPVRLGQIVTNLLSNAARYTQASGHIRLALQADEHDAIVSVEDDGAGLTAEEIAVVFEPFRTGESRVGKHRTGLGVGLAIVRRLVELHGGSVQVSSPGKGLGSRFTVRLPLTSAGSGGRSASRP